MDCPNCSTNIPEGSKFCPECGHRLTEISKPISTSTQKVSGRRITLFDELMQDSGPNGTTAAELDNDEYDFDTLKSTTEPEIDTDSVGVRQTESRRYCWNPDNDDNTPFINNDDDDGDTMTDYEHPEKRSNAAFWIVIVVLLLLIVALCYVWLKKNYNGSIELLITEWTGESAITIPATLTNDEAPDGSPAVLITVYARNGCTVRFEEGSTVSEYVVTDHYVAIRVPLSLWMPTEPVEGGVISITPTVFVIDPTTNEVSLVEFAKPLEVQIPSVTIDLVLPETHELETSNNTVEIAGYVSDVTASVFMGETQLQINESGYFRGIYHLTDYGTHVVYIEARKSGYEVGKTKLTITYTKSAIAPTITNESLRTEENTIEVTGTMAVGAELSVTGIELEGELNVNSEAGTFSFVAKVPTVGLYTPTLTLKLNGVTSPTEIFIEHAPDKDDYVRSAWAYDYQWIVEHPTMMNKHFGISGKVVEIYQSEPYVKARLKTDDGTEIIFAYYGGTEIGANDSIAYRIYAYPDGTDTETGLPMMYCWFVYNN